MEDCPKCGKDSGIELNFETLLEPGLKCKNCGVGLTVEYEEDWDGEEEYGYFWLTVTDSLDT